MNLYVWNKMTIAISTRRRMQLTSWGSLDELLKPSNVDFSIAWWNFFSSGRCQRYYSPFAWAADLLSMWNVLTVAISTRRRMGWTYRGSSDELLKPTYAIFSFDLSSRFETLGR